MSQRKACDVQYWKHRTKVTDRIEFKYERKEKLAKEVSDRMKNAAQQAREKSDRTLQEYQKAERDYHQKVAEVSQPSRGLSGASLIERSLFCKQLQESAALSFSAAKEEEAKALIAEENATQAKKYWLLVHSRHDVISQAGNEQRRRIKIAGELISDMDAEDEASLKTPAR